VSANQCDEVAPSTSSVAGRRRRRRRRREGRVAKEQHRGKTKGKQQKGKKIC
jgi:hypothetical protein